MHERSVFRNLARNIYKLRKAHGLSMATVSLIAKISRSHYSKIEKGKTAHIMTGTLTRLGLYYKCTSFKIAAIQRYQSEQSRNNGNQNDNRQK